MLEQSVDPASAQQQAYGMLYGMLQQQAGVFAYVDTFRWLALLCLICAPLVLLFRKTRSRGGPIAAH
jgi:DHA2 family multidrug resistance protein